VGPYTLALPVLQSARELDYLHHLAKDGEGTGCVVEIGTMAGGTAVALALASRDSGRGLTYTIDVVARPEVHDVLDAHGVSNLVNVITISSKTAATNWRALAGPSTSIRLLWIDGDHRYDGVWTEILHWQDYLEPGGIICFHDYDSKFPGVVRAVYEYVVSSPLYHDFRRVDSILSAVKRK